MLIYHVNGKFVYNNFIVIMRAVIQRVTSANVSGLRIALLLSVAVL